MVGPRVAADHCPGTALDEDQGGGSPRAQVLRLDRRLHPRLPVYLPADVDRQERVRRVGAVHCAPEVLLSASAGCKSTAIAA